MLLMYRIRKVIQAVGEYLVSLGPEMDQGKSGRYWVGGTATWGPTAAAKWATEAGPESEPPTEPEQLDIGIDEPPPPTPRNVCPAEFPPTGFPYEATEVTLAQAQSWLTERVQKGVACPCCTQFTKVYARTITSTMAYALICIYRQALEGKAPEWLHVPDYLTRVCDIGPTVRGGDWAKLTAWGLLEEEPDGLREDGSSRMGFYRITEAGKAFVRGETTLPRYALFYDGRVLRLDATKIITINSALGKRFNYQELMSPAPSGL